MAVRGPDQRQRHRLDGKDFLRAMAGSDREREAAMRVIYPELLRRTRSICWRGGLYGNEDVQDILQGTCEAMLRKWPDFRGDGSVYGWAWQIARHLVMDHHRYNGRFIALPDESDENPSPGMAPFAAHERHEAEQRQCIQQILDQLEQEKRPRTGAIRTIDMIRFVIEVGSDSQTLANHLGTTVAAARERKRYVLAKFRELCEHFCGHPECRLT